MEPIIDPELPIIDAHHHLFFWQDAQLREFENSDILSYRLFAPVLRRKSRYLLEEFLADVETGHNIIASIFIEANAMYRQEGPEEMKSIGEVEFACGSAAMAESGTFGPVAACAGIVGNVKLSLGAATVTKVLEAHIQAAGGRYRGVRCDVAHDEDPRVGSRTGPNLLMNPSFRDGFARLKDYDLSFDVIAFEPQLPELVDLARAFPEIPIVVNHCGAPLGIGRYEGTRDERFPIWRQSIKALSDCHNVVMKLGGLGMPFVGLPSYEADPPFNSETLAQEWRPYVETCIEYFGADRSMFQSNFPGDAAVGEYRTVWNAFKRLASNASADEKRNLFSNTASSTYNLKV